MKMNDSKDSSSFFGYEIEDFNEDIKSEPSSYKSTPINGKHALQSTIPLILYLTV